MFLLRFLKTYVNSNYSKHIAQDNLYRKSIKGQSISLHFRVTSLEQLSVAEFSGE